MNFDDVQKIWSEQLTPPVQNPAADSALLNRVRDEAARFERTYRRKDYLEVFITLLACAVMTWIARVRESPLSIVSALAFLPIPVGLLLFRLKNRRALQQSGDDMKHAIKNALDQLRKRRDWMRVYIWICVGSFLVASLFSRIHHHVHTPSPEQTSQSIIQTAFSLAVATLMLLGSRTHIRTKIDPQIADLEAKQRTFLCSETPAS